MEPAFSINSAISQGDGKVTCPFPTAGKPKLGSARSHDSPAWCSWLKGQKRQEKMSLLLAREGPGLRAFDDIVAFRLLPVTTEPAKHTDLQHLPVGGLEMRVCQYKDRKACLGNSDMMIIAIAYNHP